MVWSRGGIRIAHHRHTARHLPWHYTSYTILYFFIVLAAGLVLFATQRIAQAGIQSAQGSIVVSTTVTAAPPTNPAHILLPPDQQHFDTNVIQASGTCTPNLFIELHRNGAFSGMTLCTTQGAFEVGVTLLPGENRLVARTKDGANQYGPDSPTVIVFYDVPKTHPDSSEVVPAQPGRPSSIGRFLVYSDASLHGVQQDKVFRLMYEINGGQVPYAVSIDWGDESSPSVIPHDQEGDYVADHTYTRTGQFVIKVSGSDSKGRQALFQTLVIVHNTQVTDLATPGTMLICEPDGACIATSTIVEMINRYLWPAMIVAVLMTFSFWVGERVVWRHDQSAGRKA